MSKPEWKDAPSFAKWLAQDQCGDWWWYAVRPIEEDNFFRHVAMTRRAHACSGEQNYSWQKTLEYLP